MEKQIFVALALYNTVLAFLFTTAALLYVNEHALYVGVIYAVIAALLIIKVLTIKSEPQ